MPCEASNLNLSQDIQAPPNGLWAFAHPGAARSPVRSVPTLPWYRPHTRPLPACF